MKNKTLLAAAIAGVIGAAGSVHAHEMGKDGGKKDMGKKGPELVSCYGVNSCSGKGKCGNGMGASCAGTNKCKGQGWLPMPKESCLAIEGGSLEPKKS
jgi:uncharacterized membrane protein